MNKHIPLDQFPFRYSIQNFIVTSLSCDYHVTRLSDYFSYLDMLLLGGAFE